MDIINAIIKKTLSITGAAAPDQNLPEVFKAEAKRAVKFVEQGFKGYKMHSAVPGKIDDPSDQTIDTVTEVRKAVGDKIDILVDVNGAYSVHHAIEVGKKLQDLGVFHFEEPRPHYD